jgi:hypothetical protein
MQKKRRRKSHAWAPLSRLLFARRANGSYQVANRLNGQNGLVHLWWIDKFALSASRISCFTHPPPPHVV